MRADDAEAQTSYNDPVNTRVEPLDAAFPGTLPVSPVQIWSSQNTKSTGTLSTSGIFAKAQVLDQEAIRLSTMTALALQCEVVSLTPVVLPQA
jgi:Asp-tRNA(Asn)/Glu-tRNA(Gln) amidotransferase B subunit